MWSHNVLAHGPGLGKTLNSLALIFTLLRGGPGADVAAADLAGSVCPTCASLLMWCDVDSCMWSYVSPARPAPGQPCT